MFDAVILGGGAAGLACAITAAREGKSVCVLERNADFGKKILATGNGRCNVSNLQMGPRYYHGADPSFTEPSLREFPEEELAAFFSSLGMPLTAQEDGRIFPHTLQAKTVVAALVQGALDAGAELRTDAYCKHVQKKDDFFVITLFDNRTVQAKRLVLAAGGASMRKSGSDGNGYALAERLGHTVTDIFPGIVALTLKGRRHKALDGVKLTSKLTLTIDGQTIREDGGDILFTAYGLSGPPVLQQSRHVLCALKKGRGVRLAVSLLTEDWMHTNRFYAFLKQRRGSIRDVLSLLIHDRIPPVLLKDIGIREDTLIESLSHKQLQLVIDTLRAWTFEPDGSRPLEQAQVSCGGVDTKEVRAETLESEKVPGLYFIGEILDVDGDCGGYNLHWAFASGIRCAKAL